MVSDLITRIALVFYALLVGAALLAMLISVFTHGRIDLIEALFEWMDEHYGNDQH